MKIKFMKMIKSMRKIKSRMSCTCLSQASPLNPTLTRNLSLNPLHNLNLHLTLNLALVRPRLNIVT
jgi:hypothetical protein